MKTSQTLKVSVTVLTLASSLLVAVIVTSCLFGRTLATAERSPTEQALELASEGQTIIIDHNAVDADVIPQAALDAARQQAVFFNHRSIGNNILEGMADLATQDPSRYSITIVYGHGTGEGINHYMAGANGRPLSKVSGFSGLVEDGHDAAFMKFCVGDFPPWTTVPPADIWVAYRDAMENLQAQHADSVIVWWTSPLTTQTDGRGLEHFAAFNDLVRQHVAQNGGVLFDMADIESHDPSGNPISSGSYEAMYDGYSDDGAHLNAVGRQRVARGMWWLLARIVGWPGSTYKTYLPVLSK